MAKGKWIKKIVEVDLEDIIELDAEGFLDLLSEESTGSSLLSDIQYKAVGVEKGMIQIEVQGDTSMIEEEEEGDAFLSR